MAAFAPEVITHLGPLPVTNTLIHTLIVDGVLLFITFYLTKRLSVTPKGLQGAIEPVIEWLYSLAESTAPSKKVLNAIFPIVATFFLFILVANFTGLLPGVGTIGFFHHKTEIRNTIVKEADKEVADTKTENAADKTETKKEESAEEFTPLIRGATTDINLTFALAGISALLTHVFSIRFTGIKDYFTRWFSLNPINLYVGVLELVSELTKVISLSFRLFGNIYAGEVTLHTISALSAFIVPLPFILLESIVSLVQALVFSILTLVFMSMLATPHHAAEHAETNHS